MGAPVVGMPVVGMLVVGTLGLSVVSCSRDAVEALPEGAAEELQVDSSDPAGSGPTRSTEPSAPDAQDPTARSGQPSPTLPTPTLPTSGVAGPVDPSAVAVALARVEDSLLRYDTALTLLAAEPESAAQPDGALRQAWNDAVTADTTLAVGMLTEILEHSRTDATRVVPGPDGLSWRHVPLKVTVVEPQRIVFSWCGHSPGVRVRLDDGVVVDDGVGHSHGVGELREEEGRWRVAALDQLDLAVLSHGSADPCPAERAPAGTTPEPEVTP